MKHLKHLQHLSRLAFFAGVAVLPLAANARVLITADGPGATYERFMPLYGIEVPDCGHMVPHITEEMDAELGKPVFVFHAHVNQDDDRCRSSDRQRTEVRGRTPETAAASGQTWYYRWKFKLPSGFQSASSFTHIMQIKSDGADPIATLTPRSGNLSVDGRIGVRGGTSLGKFLNVWVVAEMTVLYGNSGRFELNIKKLNGGEMMLSTAGGADTWDDNSGGHDPKWGIYRSLSARGSLRDEQVRFADFCVSSVSMAECADDFVPPPDAGAPPGDAGVDASGTGGVSGAGGNAGTGGVSGEGGSGGVSGEGGSSGSSGGRPGQGGQSAGGTPAGKGGTSAPEEPPPASGGCGCDVGGARPAHALLLPMALALLALARRRRR